MTTTTCYHCGLPVAVGTDFAATVLGERRSMCCHGCQAVAEAIVENGLQDYYSYRTEMPKTAQDLVPEEMQELALYDHPEMQKGFVLAAEGEVKQASLILEGITCAACIWLNERHLKQLPGVHEVAFNYATHRARIAWDEQTTSLSRILAEIRKLGYHAHPFSAQQQETLRQQQRKIDFRRLAVAGLSSSQVMMIAIGLYVGPSQGMDPDTAQVLRWFSLVISIPALLYSAWPFYRAAWRGVITRRMGMDVPIALGLLTGFAGSVWVTLQGEGTIYYDTLTMLVFFLLATRYLERNARERSVEAAENLLRLVPAMATRVDDDGGHALVPLTDIAEGDLILVKPGETVAADGVVATGTSNVDESLLTGESHPLPKSAGSEVYAGSINYESPLTVRVTGIGEKTMLAGISRLLDRAQADKPRLARIADRVAAYFTYILLFAVVVVAFWWWHAEPARMLEIVLAVLVVSCPCALSLAAPAAFAAAGSHLVRRGVLLTRGHALESLARVTHVVFDKTGTLSVGQPQLLDTVALAEHDAAECLRIAASLERSSEHPLARSLTAAAGRVPLYEVSEAANVPGHGVTGIIDGRHYSLGNAVLGVAEEAIPAMPTLSGYPPGATLVWLRESGRALAVFVLADRARPEAKSLIQTLQHRGVKVSILSGDAAGAVMHFADMLGIATWQASLTPERKLAAVQDLQRQGDVVAMVGDGINDAPVLAGAQVSIAMGSGTQMARATGDIILLNENLLEIDHALQTSRFGVNIIRQNFAWALVYNGLALPFAAAGLISPWLAAIGMSVSSLIVVLNALRLR